jgi:hypothetical protein
MTGGLLPPGAPEFVRAFHSFRLSAFRLETLQEYANSDEDNALAAFRAGATARPPDPLDDEWEDMIRSHVRAGRSMSRVHVVVEPLTDYMRFELTWAYAPTVLAGEDVRIVSIPRGGSWPEQLPGPGTDFWLFDSAVLYRQHYGEAGWWLGSERVEDPREIARACQWRDQALNLAVPWRDFVRGRRDLIPYLPAEVLG